jgi:hypothetical protein
MQDTSCLYSTIKNTSGGIKNFGFLPPHGRTLANNEEFTIFGDVRQALGGNRGNERSVQRTTQRVGCSLRLKFVADNQPPTLFQF